MRVLVAGSTGVLGAPTARALAAAGHDVVGLVRTEEKARAIESFGATPAVGDVLDPASLIPAAKGADAIVHLASSDTAFEAVRVEGCRNLVAAAKAAGVRRFVVGSGYWIFGHHEGIITEEVPIDEAGVGRTNLAAERVALAANRAGAFEVVVARPGMVYGPGHWFADMVERLRAGAYRYVGDGANQWSPVHPADAGEAFRTLVETGRAGEVYLVVDEEPVPVRQFSSHVAELLKVPAPEPLPLADAEALLGAELAHALAANRAAWSQKL